eukprot:TRINITY_DN895_c0_g2_i3.p1 TRINITY_DN895_c0_g2~~TRINITY_DN895_c0_g2_i3.p1  ORF type:complete len:504 (+),score=139.48 TRINITY_DN895_c0_g2_i3:61-1512(+)
MCIRDRRRVHGDSHYCNRLKMFSESKIPAEEKKSGVENISIRKKRDEFTTEIRRQKREEEISKIRNITDQGEKLPSIHNSLKSKAPTVEEEQMNSHIDACLKRKYEEAEVPILIKAALSDNFAEQFFGIVGLRKILAQQSDSPIQEIIDANLIPRLLEYMQDDSKPHLQLEAAWVLTNIASGTTIQTQTMVDKGAIPLFIRLFGHKHLKIAEQAIWALGNMAGDNIEFRDQIIEAGGIDRIIYLYTRIKNQKSVKNVAWALSNLCRGSPPPNYESVKLAVPVFGKMILDESDSETLSEALWALVNLTDNQDDEKLDDILTIGIIPRLAQLLQHKSLNVVIPTVRVLGHVLSGAKHQTDEVLKTDAVAQFRRLLSVKRKLVKKEVCFCLSNITAGTSDQVSHVVRDEELVKKLLDIALNHEEDEIKREAIWVLANATNHGTEDDIYTLLKNGLYDVYLVLLDSQDIKTVLIVLESLLYLSLIHI